MSHHDQKIELHQKKVVSENIDSEIYFQLNLKENLTNLWKSVGHTDVGFCFDTCHGWAAGIDLKTAVKELMTITKRIDLIHANGSRDEFDSSRDRHSNFAASILPQEEIAQVVQDASCNVIIETAEPGVSEDIKFLLKAIK